VKEPKSSVPQFVRLVGQIACCDDTSLTESLSNRWSAAKQKTDGHEQIVRFHLLII
jgi:hypothetical protein